MNQDQTNPMFLSKDRVVQILQGAPSGTTPLGIIAGLREKGYKLEGYDQASQPQQPTPDSGGILSGIGSFLKGIFTPNIPGTTDVGTGVLKSVGDTAVGTYNLGAKIGSKIAQPLGLKPVPQIQSPDILKPTSPEQEIGKTIGEVAQFFAPGSEEIKATEGLDKLVDSAKFAEKFGPEAGKALNGILKVIGHGITTGASTGGVQALQSGGDVSKTESAATLGGLAGGLGKVAELFGPKILTSLAKSGFKFTSPQEAQIGQKGEQAGKFLVDNGIYGSDASKFRKTVNINNQLEDTLQASVGKDTKISTDVVKKELDQIPETFKDQGAVYDQIKSEAESAKNNLDTRYPDKQISLNSLLSNKRSYGSSAFGKSRAITKGTYLVKEGDFAIEQAYENALESGLKDSGKSIKIPSKLQSVFGGKESVSLSEFNKVYSQALNAKKYLNIAQYKSDSGLMGTLFGLWAGKTFGYAVTGGLGGEIVGGAAGEIAASKAGETLRRVGETTTRMAPFAPEATKIGLGLSQDNTQQDQPTNP